MDKAYFVGRKEILRWLNDTFDTNFTKIEETASGSLLLYNFMVLIVRRSDSLSDHRLYLSRYTPTLHMRYLHSVFVCLDAKVPLHKVKWDAKSDYEFIQNYKILQQVFKSMKIDKVVCPLYLIESHSWAAH